MSQTNTQHQHSITYQVYNSLGTGNSSPLKEKKAKFPEIKNLNSFKALAPDLDPDPGLDLTKSVPGQRHSFEDKELASRCPLLRASVKALDQPGS